MSSMKVRYYRDGAGWIPVRQFFVRTHKTTGLKVDALDFEKMSDTMYEAELIWGPTGRLNSRPWVNWVPRDARNHFLECNYCRFVPSISIEPRGRWRLEGVGRRVQHVKHYVIALGRLRRRYVLRLPSKCVGSPWRRGVARQLIRERKRKAKIDFVSQHFYPFDTDGRCLGRGDLLLCTQCALTILVMGVESGRIAIDKEGRLMMKRVEIMQDSREFFSHLYQAIRVGDYEKAKQERLAEDYKFFFPHR